MKKYTQKQNLSISKVIILLLLLTLVSLRVHSQCDYCRDARRLLKKEKFKISRKKQDIPNEIVHYMEKNTRFKFIFSEGDSTTTWTNFSRINDTFNIRRELIFIAQFENNYLLHYKHKGLGYHCHGFFFHIENGEVTKLCFIEAIIGFWDFNQYKSYVLQKKLRFCDAKRGIFETQILCEGFE